MGFDAIESFFAQAAENEGLQKELDAAFALAEGGVAAIVDLGARRGYDFTSEDLVAVADMARLENADGELSDRDLAQVAGGGAIGYVKGLDRGDHRGETV